MPHDKIYNGPIPQLFCISKPPVKTKVQQENNLYPAFAFGYWMCLTLGRPDVLATF